MIGSRIICKPSIRSYIVPSLAHLKRETGLSGVFTKEGLKTAWFDRAEYYVGKINEVTKSDEQPSLENIVADLGSVASKRTLYNYSSLLYNLKFAFSTLQRVSASLPDKPEAHDLLKTGGLALNYGNEPMDHGCERLHQELVQSFGSIVEFRTLLLNSNLAISGDGYTWLVARKAKGFDTGTSAYYDKLFIVNTYNAGSPFNLNKIAHFKQLESTLPADENNTYPKGNIGAEDGIDRKVYTRNTEYVPLLALDASPKTWLHDYGVFGKQRYLDRLWEAIDWNLVETKLPVKQNTARLNF